MSAAISRFFRVIAIQRTLIRHGFDEMLFATPVLRSLAFLRWLMPWNWIRQNYGPRADRLRAVLEELGPIYVKFGQILSTRRDLLPDDIVEEFSKLQDRVPPFPGAEARRIVERAFGVPITAIFCEFDETPLASASIAQVHAAKLKEGREVIVKVVRPGIRKTIEHDFGLIRLLAGLAERYWSHGRRLKPTRIVAEFEKTILDELDMMREAANASQLRRNFAGSPFMRVPEVHWAYTRQNVLVMERVSGINIDNIDELRAAGFDLHELATRGVELFFTQVFRDHFFHADVHPGNLFVTADPDTGRAVFAPVDFGIMGSLSEFDQRYLAENFSAFLDRDYRRVAALHVESGWVPADTRVDDFEFAIRAVCEPIFDRPVKDISVGSLLLRLFQTAQRFHMEILPQLLLLQKTLVNVEGIGRQLDPELDLWRTARPSLERFMKDRMGIGSVLRAMRQGYPRWADRLPELPGLALDVLDRLKAGRLEIANRDPVLADIRKEIRRAHRRLVYAVLGVGFVITASVLQVVDTESTHRLAGFPWSMWIFGGLGLTAMMAALRPRTD